MKVLITGGLGFLGQSLAQYLLKKKKFINNVGIEESIEKVILFDLPNPKAKILSLDPLIEIVTGNINDSNQITHLLDNETSIFHLASMVSSECEPKHEQALQVNLDGMRALLDSCHALQTTPKIVFASSIAVFGGELSNYTDDFYKQTPQTTYGMTKAMGEMLINDYTRKGFIDGRSARLPTTIIRPGKPNKAASSFVSGIFRDPLAGLPISIPVSPQTEVAILGHQTCISCLTQLHDASSIMMGVDRAFNLPATTFSVKEMVEVLNDFSKSRGINLGSIEYEIDSTIQNIVNSWPSRIIASRAKKLGLPKDKNLTDIIEDYIGCMQKAV